MLNTDALMPVKVREDDAIDLHIMYDILNPLDIEKHELEYRPNATLKEYLDGLPKEVDWLVFHNGVEIDPVEKADVALKANDRISLALIPQGSGGVKSILRALVTVAFVAIGFAIGGPIGAAIGGIVAGLVNAFLLTPKPKVSDNEQETTYGIDGAKNSAVENIPFPVVYGQFRQAGNFSDVYTENVGDTQYLYIRSIMADGLIESITDVEINEQEASNFDNVSIRTTLGELNPAINSWFQNTIRMQNKNIKLDTSWTEHQTTDEVDRVRFDVMFPKGLVDIDQKKGKYRSKSVTFEVQYRLTGGTTWDALNTDVEETTVYDNAPASVQIPNSNGVQVGVRIPIADLEAASDTDEVEVSFGSFGTVTKTVTRKVKEILAESQASQTVTANDYGNTRYANWSVHEPDLGYGDWEATTNYGGIDRSVAFQSGGSFTVTDNRTAQIRRSFYTGNLPKGDYEVRIRRTNNQSNSEYILDEAYLTDIAEIENDPVSVSGRATLSVRVKLTDQLNSIPTITALVTGSKIQKYDIDGNEVGSPVYSNRPAWHWADILMSESRGAQIPKDEVDFPALIEWAEYCEDEDLQFNGIFSNTGNVYDALVEVCTAGDAAPINLGTKNSVVIDRPRDPVQGFNSANMISGSFAITYLPQTDRANEFEVVYYDKEDRNKEKTLRYVDPNAVAFSETPRAVSVPLRGIDNKEAAAKELWKMIYANRLLVRSITFDAYTDVLSASLGDVILVQSNQMEWSQGGFVGDDSTTTVINLDQIVPNESGKTYSLIVQHDAIKVSDVTVAVKGSSSIQVTGDNQLFDKNIQRVIVNGVDYPVLSTKDGATYQTIYIEGDISGISVSDNVECWRTDVLEEREVTVHTNNTDLTTTVTLNSALSAAPTFGARYIYGETTKVNKPYTIQSITGSGVERRTVSAVEYNEAVYDPPEVDVAVPIEQINTRAVNHVKDIRVDYDLSTRINQQSVNVHVLWNSGDTRNYSGADVYARINGADYRPIGTAWNVSQFHFTANVEDEVEIKVVAFNDRMDRASMGSAPSTAATIANVIVAEEGIPINYIPSDPNDPIVPIEDLRPAEIGATEGAPAGTDVNGVPVETITQDIDDTKQDVADLIITYGSTASAAQSASDAAAAQAAAEAAQTASEAAETASETYRDAAQLAQAAAEAAETDAENSAASALVSETNAASSESEASTSETNAAASATSASTEAGNASTSATNASASETAAAVSAASASSSEALSAAYSLDSRAEGTRLLGSSANPFFEAGTTGYVAESTRDLGHSSTSEASDDWQGASNFQGAIQTINNIVSAPSLRSSPIAYDSSRVYKLYFSYWINAGSASSVRTRSMFFTSSGEYTDFDQEVENSPASGQWHDKVRTIVTSGVDADAAQIAAGPAFLNTSSDFDVHVRWCYVQDVTDVEATASSATAALLSETNASASEIAAATSETNAAASAVTANTAAGTATSAATNASTSETNASASASAASTSETLAASYVLEAADAVGASVPSTFDSDQNHFSMVGPGAPSVTYETVSGKGDVWQLSNSNYVQVVSRNGTPLVANHTYLIEAELRVLSGAAPEDQGVIPENRVGDDLRLAVGSVGSSIGGTTLVGSNKLPSDDTWTTISWKYTCPSSPPAGYIYGAYLVYAGNVTSDRTVQGFRLSVKDITSEDAAAASAAAAVVSESNAAASATGASTSESNAATSAATASTEAGNASSSATAASASQTAASDSASSAASSASLAATYASDAENAETEATAQAAIATSQAATATSEAAAAASSSVLAASYSRGSGLTPNSHFKDGTTLWYGGFLISQNTQFDGTVLTDYQDAPYVMQVSTGSRTDMHGEASEIDTDRIYRVRARFYTTGNNTQMYIGHSYSDGQNGTQAQKYSATSGSTYNTGWHEIVGSPITGTTASVNSFATNSREAAPFTLCNFNNSGNTVVFDYLYLEDITDSEAIENISASVTINSSAIASIEGAAAYYETVVAADGSTPAKVRLTAGDGGSAVSLIAESITIENPVDGALVEVARFEDGKARLNNAVIRGLSVLPRSDSEIAMPVLLEPLQFLATDGDNVEYQGGDTFGAIPSRIVPDLSGLPTPAAGNSYDVRAINITATDFDVYAKEIIAPTNTTQSAGNGTNVGGTPKFRSNKPSSADAYNNQYQFFFAGSIPRTYVEFEPTGGGQYQYWAEYSGYFDVYVSDSASSNTLTKVATVLVSASNSGTVPSTAAIPTSSSFSTSRVINTSIAIGQHGSYEFGMHPVGSSTLTSMSNVQYTTQTSSGTTSLTDLIPWSVYQPAAD